ncbi:SulP family inorganic anion transporter [Aquabacterium sp. A7-Y]|uniref:SulP family inorganic anion transporter n=1 Tax=Aquabacterium sp. A7-Y TaxID=1349605 RepID=UPI00223DDCBA|nr:SulP family inorganic anion transporter [Aquabacterium sp. A7-Y]MCW7539010.1 SulP family inorganic anion transporter [Aquabacterium sp. A7-Y]
MTDRSPAHPPLLARLFGPWVQELSPASLRADLLAALLGAVLVLPQGIAFATLAGLPPQYGLYTAIVPCAVAALFGSSRHVVSGPTNANSLALFAMLTPLALAGSPAYIELALAVTVLVGLMQTTVALLRLGSIANFISPAALLGFTGGAAALIGVHALKDLAGFGRAAGTSAPAVLQYLATHIQAVHPGALMVGLLTLVVALGLRRLRPRWPVMLIGLAAGTLLAVLLKQQGGRWRVASVGAVPSAWPPFHVPRVDLDALPELLGLAFALTIVALGQSISIAKAVAARSGQRLDANREFLGQGLSNLVGGFFSSYVSCGSLNRSLPNLEAGARTPLAALFSAALLVALLAVAAPLLGLIPLAGIAGLLLLIAWNLLDLPRWHRLARTDRTEFGIAAATLVATVTIRLETAILLGTILSLVCYLWRTSRPAMRTMGFDTMAEERPFVVVDDRADALPECPQLKLLRMEGSVYFGAAQHVADRLHALRTGPQAPPHLLVMSKSMNFIDVAGAEVWETELAKRRAAGGDLYFHRPRPPVVEMWERSGFIETLGRDHIFPDKRSAIAGIFEQLDPRVCAACRARVFWECDRAPFEPASPGEKKPPSARPSGDLPPRESAASTPSLADGERASGGEPGVRLD